ncbi:MAG: asparaginase [Deltaproteobacteria bacterium]|nr:MAG: asparaginase [Deltaproteobacteria bacterium]
MKIPAPLAKVTRGGLTESIHRGHFAVVRPDGALLDSLGDPDFPTFLRSAAKPFQTVPVVEEGAAAHFGFTEPELAVMCGSHSGQDFHVEAVRSILTKAGVGVEALECGVHRPSHRPTAKALADRGEAPSPLHNNCSGKHAAMLALCAHKGWPVEGYIEPGNPVQLLIRRYVAECCGTTPDELGIGVDGCGVPVFRAPLRSVARGFASFAWPEGNPALSRERISAIRTLMRSCLDNPEMVAGDERICTEAMRAAPGRVIAKTGAEASYGIAFIDAGVGVAFKVEDGNMRALEPIVVELMLRMGTISEEEAAPLSRFRRVSIKNHRRETVGLIEAIIDWRGLDRPDKKR